MLTDVITRSVLESIWFRVGRCSTVLLQLMVSSRHIKINAGKNGVTLDMQKFEFDLAESNGGAKSDVFNHSSRLVSHARRDSLLHQLLTQSELLK